MKKLAVLISNGGTGSNLQAIIDAISIKKINAEIAVVISDTEDAYGLQRAKEANIPTHIYNPKTEKLEELLTKIYPIDYIILTGWKKIISKETIAAFAEKILNIHPGLIPDTMDGIVKNPDGTNALWNRGMYTEKAIKNFLDMHATYAGSTVHFLSNEFDFGKVLERCFEKISPEDTVETLYERLKKKEHEIYIQALAKLSN